MARTKEFIREVEAYLFDIYKAIGIDRPENHEAILEFVADDVLETADPLNWHSGDVSIAFRRWMENQTSNVQKDSDYFQIKSQGYNHELEREEIQIHCGENGNLFLIKTEEGFIVDVYNQGDNVDTMTIWEEDLE